MGKARTTPVQISVPPTRYLFFGGKGGVGKTTCAAATALLLLDQAEAHERILLFSTDPAHSLADSVGAPIGNGIQRLRSRHGAILDAWEMDAAAALEDFKERHSAILKTIADRGTLLDDADIQGLLDLSLPGMDEVMALFALSEFDRADVHEPYSRIVVDTAPSGHTTRLLQLPEVFTRWIRALDRMSDKHRYMVAHIARRGAARVDEVDAFLNDLTERLERVRNILYSKEKSSFVMVTIPEFMAVEETRRYAAQITSQGTPVTDLIVNRVETVHRACKYCKARVEGQEPYLQQLDEEFHSLRRKRIPLLSSEVQGIENLRAFGEMIWKGKRRSSPQSQSEGDSAMKSEFRRDDSLFPPSLKRVFVIGGKGGVGKTTTAAALAISLAQRHPEKRFLIVSTDPAHSLSDSVGEPVGSFKRGICGLENLDAIEIDSIETFEQLKDRYRRWIDEIFSALMGGSSWNVEFDREAMQELIALAPPGMDEIAALSAVSDYLEEESYASIVLDTAPTGHLLRFLELPAVALEWVRTFIKMLLKYRTVVTSSSVAEELVALSKSIKRVMGALKDSHSTEVIAVAIPERMSLTETEDLGASLTRLAIPLGSVVVNNVVPETAALTCAFCKERRRRQLHYVEEFQNGFHERALLFVAPQMPGEVRGEVRLREFWAGLLSVVLSKARGKGES